MSTCSKCAWAASLCLESSTRANIHAANNGVPWSQTSHNPTGCMSQYGVVPVANDSAVNIGSMALDSWFAGAIGKVAIYDTLLTQAQITAHYVAMTGTAPGGSCSATCTSM